MAITVPQLPPKKGYVEVEINGIRTYRNVETGTLINEEAPTQLDRIEAQVTYTAILTDTLITEE